MKLIPGALQAYPEFPGSFKNTSKLRYWKGNTFSILIFLYSPSLPNTLWVQTPPEKAFRGSKHFLGGFWPLAIRPGVQRARVAFGSPLDMNSLSPRHRKHDSFHYVYPIETHPENIGKTWTNTYPHFFNVWLPGEG